ESWRRPRVAGGHSPVVPVRLPCGGRRRRLSLGTGPLGVLTGCWVRAELDDRMRLNNWSIAASNRPYLRRIRLRLLPREQVDHLALLVQALGFLASVRFLAHCSYSLVFA